MKGTTTAEFIRRNYRVDQFKLFQCDNGGPLKNDLVREVVADLGGHLIHSAPYHPQSNSQIERPNGTLKQAIRVVTHNIPKAQVRWKDILPLECLLFWPNP